MFIGSIDGRLILVIIGGNHSLVLLVALLSLVSGIDNVRVPVLVDEVVVHVHILLHASSPAATAAAAHDAGHKAG